MAVCSERLKDDDLDEEHDGECWMTLEYEVRMSVAGNQSWSGDLNLKNMIQQEPRSGVYMSSN
jgi:hypothetical protein